MPPGRRITVIQDRTNGEDLHMRILLTIPLSLLLVGCGGDSSNDTGSSPAATGTTPAAQTAPAGGGAGAGKAATVEISDFKFGEAITVAKGAEVTFVNLDAAPHNAVGDGFKSADLTKGESDVVTFDTAGTFDYVCTFHPFMKGSITVQ